ncbi:unnamed protein product [marine sediment metagenome]|uniref:Uncharacterized protein n=1 Tax=marine sediment metagenome TaxID=412755 RepID=X0ZJP2_9ZZZZ
MENKTERKIPVQNFIGGMFVLWVFTVITIGTLSEFIGFDLGLIIGAGFVNLLFSIIFWYSTK